ncbi:hypothetical protein Ancab_012302 [Ancistrocladus abbreviatus]
MERGEDISSVLITQQTFQEDLQGKVSKMWEDENKARYGIQAAEAMGIRINHNVEGGTQNGAEILPKIEEVSLGVENNIDGLEEEESRPNVIRINCGANQNKESFGPSRGELSRTCKQVNLEASVDNTQRERDIDSEQGPES